MIDSGWMKIDDLRLEKEFKFKNFKKALAFVNQVGDLAEKLQHHPDIFIHDWRFVKISLTTHEIGGISEKDTKLAAKIDTFF